MLPILLPSVVRWHSTTTEDLFAMENRSDLPADAIRRSLEAEATTLTGISTFLPKPPARFISEAVHASDIRRILAAHNLTATPADIATLSRMVNPPTAHAGGRPRKVTTINAYPHEFDIPKARGVLSGFDRGNANYAKDATSRPGLLRFADHSPASDYHHARSLVIRQRVAYVQGKSAYRSLAARRRNVNA
jgi:hypothetical protein